MIFTTEEAAQYEAVWLVLSTNSTYSPFSKNKLLLSLLKSCQHRSNALKDAEALSETVVRKLQPKYIDGVISAHTIAQVAQVALNRFDQAASVNYGAFHQIKN